MSLDLKIKNDNLAKYTKLEEDYGQNTVTEGKE